MCTGIGLDVFKAVDIKVQLAQHNLSNKNSDSYERSIRAITIHPKYSCTKSSFDIAILELDQQVIWSKEVSPVCLPLAVGFKTIKPNFPQAVVAGWGWTNENTSKGSRANILQKAKVTVFDNQICQKWFKTQGKKTEIKATQMCAGHEQGGIDACWADSGGPLMISTSNHGQTMIIGIVSTGIGCGRPYLPGIYTRISEFIPWINSIILE